jgi:hypothetical protein
MIFTNKALPRGSEVFKTPSLGGCPGWNMAKRYKPQDNGNGNGNGCCFGWAILKEMKENHVEFWAADEYKKLQIVQIDERARDIYMICRQTGKITWPLSYEKLEDLHIRIHEGNLALNAYEIEKCIPTWGNYVTGLLRFLGCRHQGDS